jgi:hypothetical protein
MVVPFLLLVRCAKDTRPQASKQASKKWRSRFEKRKTMKVENGVQSGGVRHLQAVERGANVRRRSTRAKPARPTKKKPAETGLVFRI